MEAPCLVDIPMVLSECGESGVTNKVAVMLCLNQILSLLWIFETNLVIALP